MCWEFFVSCETKILACLSENVNYLKKTTSGFGVI